MRRGPGSKTTLPNVTAAVCGTPSAFCQRFTAAVVWASQCVSTFIADGAYPSACRFCSSSCTSGPFVIPGREVAPGRHTPRQEHHRMGPVERVQRSARVRPSSPPAASCVTTPLGAPSFACAASSCARAIETWSCACCSCWVLGLSSAERAVWAAFTCAWAAVRPACACALVADEVRAARAVWAACAAACAEARFACAWAVDAPEVSASRAACAEATWSCAEVRFACASPAACAR